MQLLDREAARIWDAIFGGTIPPIVRERFRSAIDRMNAELDEEELAHHYHIIETVGDLEALEMISRLTRRHPTLTNRFRVMVHLAETLPEKQHLFVNREMHRLGAWSSLTASALRSAAKLAKGWLLSRKIGDG